MNNDVKTILKSIDYILRYGSNTDSINSIKYEIGKLDTDTKLFILSEYPGSIIFMCENQPEEFMLEVVEFYPEMFIYFANIATEKVCIKAIEYNVNNYHFIEKPSLLLNMIYNKMINNK